MIQDSKLSQLCLSFFELLSPLDKNEELVRYLPRASKTSFFISNYVSGFSSLSLRVSGSPRLLSNAFGRVLLVVVMATFTAEESLLTIPDLLIGGKDTVLLGENRLTHTALNKISTQLFPPPFFFK